MIYCYPRAICAFAVLVLLRAIPLQAQVVTPGVTSTSIQLGSCSALSGRASFLGMETQMGALAYFPHCERRRRRVRPQN